MSTPITPEPLLLQFETNTKCNAACTFCQHRNMKRSGTAKWSQIISILYNYAHKANEICPFGMQEPLLEPRFSAILANCKQLNRNAQTVVYSNMSIYDEATWREIIMRGTLDTLRISFYGIDKKTYNTLQPGLDYEQVQSNIKRLVKLRRRMRWNKPELNIHLVLMPETGQGAIKFIRKWKPIMDHVALMHYDSWHGELPYDDEFEATTWGPRHERVPCHRLWSSLNIHYDGTVVPCCIDYNDTMPMGNIHEDANIWAQGEKMQQMRSLHLQKRWNEIPLCQNCGLWRYESPKEWREYWAQQKPVLSVANR